MLSGVVYCSRLYAVAGVVSFIIDSSVCLSGGCICSSLLAFFGLGLCVVSPMLPLFPLGSGQRYCKPIHLYVGAGQRYYKTAHLYVGEGAEV